MAAVRAKPFDKLRLLWSQTNTLAVDRQVPGLSDSIVGRTSNAGGFAPGSRRVGERIEGKDLRKKRSERTGSELQELGIAIARARAEQAGAQKSSQEVLHLIDRARVRQRGEQVAALTNLRKGSPAPIVLLGQRYLLDQKSDKHWRLNKRGEFMGTNGRSKSMPRPKSFLRRSGTSSQCADDSLIRYGATIDNDFAMGARVPRSCRPLPKSKSFFRSNSASLPASFGSSTWDLSVDDMYIV